MRATATASTSAITAARVIATRFAAEARARYVRPPPKQANRTPIEPTIRAGTRISWSRTNGATRLTATAAAMFQRVGVASAEAAT